MTAGRNDTRHDRNARKPMSTPLNGTVQNIPMLTVTDRQHHDDTQTHDTEHERRHDRECDRGHEAERENQREIAIVLLGVLVDLHHLLDATGRLRSAQLLVFCHRF